jgi:hypothetical protein
MEEAIMKLRAILTGTAGGAIFTFLACAAHRSDQQPIEDGIEAKQARVEHQT